jgi:hypothetical protein
MIQTRLQPPNAFIPVVVIVSGHGETEIVSVLPKTYSEKVSSHAARWRS